ncbi:RecX family transcriptional regulator [Sphingomonas sp.]|uniref:regulatory protein RecX n=1 Tax=Sphingomonas sp. TaxID=28214 RepID=UPI001823E715|nr:RecX family transcriptional regulator [Sphingomonas sp.]MBA3512690.1 RecX family transcriptional regulator [Sphingomonas sp.]
MRHARKPRPRPPLDRAKLDELALAYVGRFATTRAKLRTYLGRKVRERGWDDGQPPDLEAIAERFAARGYVDDAAYALSKSRSLTGRGYGIRRVEQSLRTAGVEEVDAAVAREHAQADSIEAALHFAERRRLGPFASEPAGRKGRERALGAMIRAGHGFGLARAIVDLPPGAEINLVELAEK